MDFSPSLRAAVWTKLLRKGSKGDAAFRRDAARGASRSDLWQDHKMEPALQDVPAGKEDLTAIARSRGDIPVYAETETALKRGLAPGERAWIDDVLDTGFPNEFQRIGVYAKPGDPGYTGMYTPLERPGSAPASGPLGRISYYPEAANRFPTGSGFDAKNTLTHELVHHSQWQNRSPNGAYGGIPLNENDIALLKQLRRTLIIDPTYRADAGLLRNIGNLIRHYEADPSGHRAYEHVLGEKQANAHVFRDRALSFAEKAELPPSMQIGTDAVHPQIFKFLGELKNTPASEMRVGLESRPDDVIHLLRRYKKP